MQLKWNILTMQEINISMLCVTLTHFRMLLYIKLFYIPTHLSRDAHVFSYEYIYAHISIIHIYLIILICVNMLKKSAFSSHSEQQWAEANLKHGMKLDRTRYFSFRYNTFFCTAAWSRLKIKALSSWQQKEFTCFEHHLPFFSIMIILSKPFHCPNKWGGLKPVVNLLKAVSSYLCCKMRRADLWEVASFGLSGNISGVC